MLVFTVCSVEVGLSDFTPPKFPPKVRNEIQNLEEYFAG